MSKGQKKKEFLGTIDQQFSTFVTSSGGLVKQPFYMNHLRPSFISDIYIVFITVARLQL